MDAVISPKQHETIINGFWEPMSTSSGVKLENDFRVPCITKLQTSSSEPEEELECSPSPAPLSTTPNSGINLALENEDLWRRFNNVNTEMIITKSGRRMFPSFSVSASGLEMDQKYVMKMICNTCDEKRYKYINSKWIVCGKAESHVKDLLSYTHTDSPASGKQWMLNKVCFKKVKLTNNRSAPKGQIILNSMHMYTPCVVVMKYISKKKSEIVHVQDFPLAAFFAVTAYQNDEVTQLKIDNNPFAKAFRDCPLEQDVSTSYGMQNSWINGTSTMSSYWSLPPPLLSGCPPVSPLITPRWPPPSPLITPYHTDFTQVTYSTATIPSASPLPQFTSAFGSCDSSSNPYALYRPNFPLPTYQPTPSILTNSKNH